jgi:hypothetical protein
VDTFHATVAQAVKEGGRVVVGGDEAVQVKKELGGFFVNPTVIEFDAPAPIMRHEGEYLRVIYFYQSLITQLLRSDCKVSDRKVLLFLIVYSFHFSFYTAFVPVLYVVKYNGSIDDAIAINNDVPQGLSSSLFTQVCASDW